MIARALIILALMWPGYVLAAPSILSVSGTLSNGETITISGSEFGSTGPTVRLFDSFEKGTVNANISTTTNSADVANWTGLGNVTQVYSTDYARSGSRAMKIDWASWYGSGPELTYQNVQNSDILISWWQYMPTNKNVPGTNGPEAGLPNWKWFWIGDSGDGWPWGSDYTTVCLDNDNCGGIMGMIPADDTATPARGGGDWYDTSFRKGTWMRYTIAMKNATSGAYIWNQELSSNGHLIKFNLTNQVTAHSTDPWNILTLPGFGRQDNTAAAYYDDVYVATGANARARVEIGNASTYAASTNLAIITPTSWGASSITATLRQGSFSAGSAYLFVVDSAGVASSGYPITLGGTVDPTPIPGSCGSNDGATLASLTSGDSNNCDVGAVSSFSCTSSACTWSCDGIDGGAPDSCTASLSSGVTAVSRGTVPF